MNAREKQHLSWVQSRQAPRPRKINITQVNWSLWLIAQTTQSLKEFNENCGTMGFDRAEKILDQRNAKIYATYHAR